MRDTERWEFIYNQINGLNESDVCEWARDESESDGVLGPLIEQVYGARDRLCERLALDPDADPDLELLLGGFERLSRACGRLMYGYGYRDGVNGK